MSAVVVIPTYQEADNVERLLRAIRDAVPELDVVIVDDNSPDGTGKIAEEVGRELGRVEVLHRPGKAGLGVAYRRGFRHVLDRGYAVVAQMDADLSHDPGALPGLLAAVGEGADVAIGSRYVPGGSVPTWTWFRRSLSRWGNAYAHFLLRLRMVDATTAFRAYRADVLELIDIDGTRANGYLFQIETAFRLSGHDVDIVEVPITFVDRVAGSSKMAVVATMVETEVRVTWWGLSLRAPTITRWIRASRPGRRLDARFGPVGRSQPLDTARLDPGRSDERSATDGNLTG